MKAKPSKLSTPPLYCPLCGTIHLSLISEMQKDRKAYYKCGSILVIDRKGQATIRGCKQRQTKGVRGGAEEVLRVTIEIIPFGMEDRKRVLGVANIINDGTGTLTSGNYYATLSRSGKKASADTTWMQRIWKMAVVGKFPRQKLGVWDLLYRVLRGTVGDRNETINEGSVRLALTDAIQANNNLFKWGEGNQSPRGSWYVDWQAGEDWVNVRGLFTVKDLEAICWWVRNKERKVQ